MGPPPLAATDRIKLDRIVEQEREVSALRLRSNYSDPALRSAPVSDPQMLQHSHAPPTLAVLPPARVCSSMLRPTRQRNTNLMVIRISGDGERFVIYSPARGTKLDLVPPPIPGNGADSFYSYATLPAGKCLVLFSEECSSYISYQVLSFPAVLSLQRGGGHGRRPPQQGEQ